MIALLPPEPRLTWDLVADVSRLFDYPFMVNALRAGTIVAVTTAVVGWFMVLRRQVFAGHTLAVVGFPGAAGALWLGVSAQLGSFAFSVTGAVALAVLGRRPGSSRPGESAVVGVVQALALAAGLLFASLRGGSLNAVDALLFGTLIGVTDADVARLAVVGGVALATLAVLARPLLFASVDPDVAEARGVPVRALSIAFTVLLGVAAAASSQVTGAVLVFALLVLPAATAQAVTTRPASGLALSVAIGLAVTWLGLGAAYYSPYPIGFWITSFAFAAYVAARTARLPARARRWRPA